LSHGIDQFADKTTRSHLNHGLVNSPTRQLLDRMIRSLVNSLIANFWISQFLIMHFVELTRLQIVQLSSPLVV